MKRAGSGKTKIQHTTRADACCHTGVTGLDSTSARIKTSALQAMYREDACKSHAVPYSFGTKVKQEDIPLIRVQELKSLILDAIT